MHRTYARAVPLVLSATHPQTQAQASPQPAQATYDGGFPDAKDVRLRVSNGGAGQAGLIGAFANAFIRWMVLQGASPFKIEWYLGDTTQSLQFLVEGFVDVAFTYNEAAEQAVMDSGKAILRELVFIDHFYLVGPKSNPAQLIKGQDSVAKMFNKLVTSGNADVARPPVGRPAVRFLSRFDKSATNIKESELFVKIGQVPWALVYSPWYHQYPRFPHEALTAASVLDEYTLTDKGTWLSCDPSVVATLDIYAQGKDEEALKSLLNPCNALLGKDAEDPELALTFMKWLVAPYGGQEVVREFKKQDQELYDPAN